MPFSTSIFDFRVILSLVLIFLILFYAFKQLSGNKLVSFSIFWFFITLIPFYNIVPIITLYQERYLYLPSFGICIVFSLFFFNLKKVSKALAIIFIVFLILSFSVGTIRRNNDWQNAEILWKKTIQTSPDFSIAYNNLGRVYLDQNKNREALKLFMKAIEHKLNYSYSTYKPEYADPYANIGIIYKRMGNYSLAIEYYKKAISLKSDYYQAHYNLGTLYNELEEYDKAMVEFIEAIKIRPTYAKAHNNLGISLINRGNIDEAIAEFKRALNINPDYKEAQNNLEFAYKVRKDLKTST